MKDLLTEVVITRDMMILVPVQLNCVFEKAAVKRICGL